MNGSTFTKTNQIGEQSTLSPAIDEKSVGETLHQVAPYIGRIRSSLATLLIRKYTVPGDVVIDPFSGCGTIPIEAALMGRKAYAYDINPYGIALIRAKVDFPPSLASAIRQLHYVHNKAIKSSLVSNAQAPEWVQNFFHPKTLQELLRFWDAAKSGRCYLLQGALLGILHHQRPGFLSYPSSHLTPYLRQNKFPSKEYPDLYKYRALLPRMEAKLQRLYKHAPLDSLYKLSNTTILRRTLESQEWSNRFDSIITSPPYMNALDYGRDNRLRLWLLTRKGHQSLDRNSITNSSSFEKCMSTLAGRAQIGLRRGKYLVLVVGTSVSRGKRVNPVQIAMEKFSTHAPSLHLESQSIDIIPDIRRSRKQHKAVRSETILVYQKQ